MSFLLNGLQLLQHAIFPPVKYHGLFNQGATCYLNSVLQVLFMTEDFRAAVERHTGENPQSEHIDRQLKSLFDDLKEDTANTLKITRKLGIARVTEQRDAAEYLEKILSLTSPEASQIFHGLLTHKTKCSTCSTEADTDGAFWLLPLALVDSSSEGYNVVDGIEEYFRATHFSGDNQMYCDECDAKSDATITCEIKHHPEVLMLLLKRFQFDYDFMEYVKLSRTVDVPCTLQIPENQTYELYAVVEHFGDLRSGHYTATIKDDEKWYNFDDSWVQLADHQPLQGDNFKKGSSAYLLFYRKTTVDAADMCTQDIEEVSTPEDVPPATSDINDINAVKIREREEFAVDVSSVESRGVELSPDYYYNVENQDIGVNVRQSIPHKYDEERNDAHAERWRDEGKMIRDDEEDMGGNAWTNDWAEKREILSRETQLEDSVKVQDNDSERQRTPDISSDFEPEVSDRHEIHGHLNKEDETSAAQRRVDDVKTDMDGKIGDDEQTKYPDREAEHQDDEDDARQNISEDLGGAQDVDLRPVSVDEQGDETRMDVDVMVDKEGKPGADERGMASERGKLMTKSDLYLCEIRDSRRVGDQRYKDGADERGMASERGKLMTKCYLYSYEIQDSESRFQVQDNDGGRQRTPDINSDFKQEVSDRHEIQRDDEQLEETKYPDREAEHQDNEDDASPESEFNEGGMEGRDGSKKSRVYQGKIIEEEIRETPCGIQRSSETKNIRIEAVVETSQHDILSKGVGDLKLSGSSSEESRKHGTKRVIENTRQENETDSASHSKKKKLKISDTQEAAEKEDLKGKRDAFENIKKNGEIDGETKPLKRRKPGGVFIFATARKSLIRLQSQIKTKYMLFP